MRPLHCRLGNWLLYPGPLPVNCAVPQSTSLSLDLGIGHMTCLGWSSLTSRVNLVLRIWGCHSNTKDRDAANLRHKLESGTQFLYEASKSPPSPCPLCPSTFLFICPTRLYLPGPQAGSQLLVTSFLKPPTSSKIQIPLVQHSSIPGRTAQCLSPKVG